MSAWQQIGSAGCAALLLLFGSQVQLPAKGLVAWWLLVTAALWLGTSSGTGVGAALVPTGAALTVVMLATICAGCKAFRPEGPTTVAIALLAAGLLTALLGLLQYYGLAEALSPWFTNQPALGQAYGNLRQRNQFATLISMALIAALWLYAVAGARAIKVRVALVPATGLLLAAAAASTSRTGLLQLIAICAVSALMAWRERRAGRDSGAAGHQLPPPLAFLAMLLVYFAAAGLLPQLVPGAGVENLLHRLRHGAPGDHSRLVLWHNVLQLIALRPWTGWGWGWGELAWAHYSTLYPGARFPEILDNAHNLPLHLAVELGIPAAVLICGGFIWLVLSARPWAERDPTRLMAWGILAVIVLHSLLEYPLWYGPFQLVFGLCLGLLWPGRAPPPGATAAPRWRIGLATLLLAGVACAAWDYTRISQLYLPREERLPAWRDDTLAKVRGSWLFASQVGFAELALTPVTRANAAAMHTLAERTLHYAPEPRVIVKLIDSAVLSGHPDEAFAQAERFRRAFPDDYARWLKGQPPDEPPAR